MKFGFTSARKYTFPKIFRGIQTRKKEEAKWTPEHSMWMPRSGSKFYLISSPPPCLHVDAHGTVLERRASPPRIWAYHKCQILPSILQTGAACRQIFWRCRSAPFPCLSAFSSLLHFNSWGFILHLWETNFIICAILSETFSGGCIFPFNIIICTPGSFGFSKKKTS